MRIISLSVTVILLLALSSVTSTFGASEGTNDPMDKVRIRVIPSEIGGIFSIKDNGKIELVADAVPEGFLHLDIDLKAKNAFGSDANIFPTKITLSRSSGFRTSLAVPKKLGYYDIFCRIPDGPKSRFSIAIIPDVRVRAKNADSPFGVNTHFNQGWDPSIGKLVAKVGIPWIRDGEANINDSALPVAKENKLCYLPCFTFYRSPMEKNKTADGKWDFSDVANVYRDFATKYGNDIDVYDIVNEPHGPWSAVLGGGWDGGEWQKTFVIFGRQVSDALKSADTNAKILWEDIDQLWWYKQFYELGVGSDSINIISPHTYNMHAERPLPEDQPVIEQLAEYKRFTKQHNLPWQVWIGETGQSSCITGPGTSYGPNTELQQAQKLVRSYLLFLASGVSKVFWYDFKNDGNDLKEPEHNFGIVHNDLSPKPAVVAYANMIDKLRDLRKMTLSRLDSGGNVFVAASISQKPMLVLWTRQGTAEKQLSIVSGTKRVKITDIFGGSRSIAVSNHKFPLKLSEMPLYIEGLTAADIKKLFQ